MNDPRTAKQAEAELVARVRAAARQEQFLEVISAEEAKVRFANHVDHLPQNARQTAE